MSDKVLLVSRAENTGVDITIFFDVFYFQGI